MRPDSASTSSTVVITGVTVASPRATATAAGPPEEPSRPASSTPAPCGDKRSGEPGDADALVAGVVAQGAAGDDRRGVGRADVLIVVADKAGVTQCRQHGVALRVVDRRQ